MVGGHSNTQGDMVGGHSNTQGDTAAVPEAMLYLALPNWKMKTTETNFTEGIDRGGYDMIQYS